MNLKTIFSICLLLAGNPWSLAQSTAGDGAYKAELDQIFAAFKTKNYELIKSMLDPRVTISNLPRGMNDAVVPQVLNQLPEPTSYSVTDVAAEGDGKRVTTTYTYAGRADRRQSFLFNRDKKITDFDVLGDAKTVTTTSACAGERPDRFEVPFELHHHLIFMKARLNGKEETFILDSGAPTLVLNADHFPATDKDATGSGQVQGVGGKADVRLTHVDTLDWYGVTLENQNAMTVSLNHLEKEAGKDFAGLIGYSIFQDYELTYDYKRKVLTFVRTDEKGAPVVNAAPSAKAVSVVPFKLQAHVPVFPMTVAGKTYQMGLDCGASSNLLYAKHLPNLKGRVSLLKNTDLSGAAKAKTQIQHGKIESATVGNANYPKMEFAFDDGNLDQLNAGYHLKIDGLLGYEFLKRYKTTVNYKKGEIRIYTAN